MAGPSGRGDDGARPMSRLFAPWSLGRLELRNRIVIAPM
jgi:hypothetical protein